MMSDIVEIFWSNRWKLWRNWDDERLVSPELALDPIAAFISEY